MQQQTYKAHETRLRVRYAETDQMGIVYHANYLIWMEVGRVELCRVLGVRYRDMEADGVLLAVVEATCRYLAPARYDEEIVVRTSLGQANTRLVAFDYEIREAAEARLLATGRTRHVFLSRDMKPIRLPQAYRPLFGV
jgi:acyl-CoA thioester hydrolase